MNILFLTSTFPRFKNDNQAPFVFEQACAWKKSHPLDNIYILAPHDHLSSKNETSEDINIRRFSYWWPTQHQKLAYPAILPNLQKNPFLFFQVPFFLLMELISACQMISTHHIDLVYAHWVMPQGLTAFFIKKLKKTPYVLQNHSSDVRIFKKIPWFGALLVKKTVKNANKLFCVNKNLENEIYHFFPVSNHYALKNKVSVLPMGVNLPELAQSKNQHNDAYQYDFGFIGRLTKKKGIDKLILACNHLKNQKNQFTAAIAGDGEERSSLEKIPNGPHVKFLGHLSGEPKIEFFRKTRIMVFPSQEIKGDIEGLPVAVLEALNMGKIVIATKATNITLLPEWEQIKEIVLMLDKPESVDEFCGLLEKALRLSKQSAWLGETSLRVKNIIRRYRWDNLIQEYIAQINNASKTL